MTANSGRPIDRSKDTAILLAARKLLIQEGVGAVTMEAVATEAGVSKATLYSRYSNRNDEQWQHPLHGRKPLSSIS